MCTHRYTYGKGKLTNVKAFSDVHGVLKEVVADWTCQESNHLFPPNSDRWIAVIRHLD